MLSSGDDEPTYALGMRSSVSFTSPIKNSSSKGSSSNKRNPDGTQTFEVPPFQPQAYAKHLGVEPNSLANPGPMYIASDRAPEVVAERRRRRHMHGLLLKERSKPFNRKILPGSLSEYGQHRVILNKLIGQTHQPGDVHDIGPPRAKLMMCPDDNDHVNYVKSDRRFGRRTGLGEEDVGPCDVDFSQTRARTVGYSPGHLRTIRARGGVVAGGFPRSSVEAQTLSRNASLSSGGGSIANAAAPTPSLRTPSRGAAGAEVRGTFRVLSTASGVSSSGGGGGVEDPQAPASASHSVCSSTARRIEYCNAMHEGVARSFERVAARREAEAERHTSESLGLEVESDIDRFEQNLLDIKAKGWKGV